VFGDALGALTDTTKVDRIEGARILCVRVGAGDPTVSEEHGLPPTGLWLVPEIYGLADILRGSG
jgi:hypothetical protein